MYSAYEQLLKDVVDGNPLILKELVLKYLLQSGIYELLDETALPGEHRPHPRFEKAYATAQQTLAVAERRTEEEWAQLAQQAYNEACRRYDEYQKHRPTRIATLNTGIAQLKEWEVPVPSFEPIRRMLLQTVKEALTELNNPDHYGPHKPKRPETVAEFKERHLRLYRFDAGIRLLELEKVQTAARDLTTLIASLDGSVTRTQ